MIDKNQTDLPQTVEKITPSGMGKLTKFGEHCDDREILHRTIDNANQMIQYHLDFFTDRMSTLVQCKDRVAQDGARE